MNQYSSINNITTAQNITQIINNTHVAPISKENTKDKSYIENESNTICRESAEQDQPNENPKSKRKSVIILGDSMIKHTNGWEIARMQTFCENLPRSNYPMHGLLHETFDSNETKLLYTSCWNKRFEFK